MKAVIWEHTGSRGGYIKKTPSKERVQKLLKKKRLKKLGKYN